MDKDKQILFVFQTDTYCLFAGVGSGPKGKIIGAIIGLYPKAGYTGW